LDELLKVLIVTGVCIAIGFIIFLRKHEADNKKEMKKTKDNDV
jgi:hypothetical protein